MAKYQPNIPTGTVKLDQDYKNLRSNFQQINTVFGTDHTTMDDTTDNLGFHKTIRIIPRNPDNDPSTKAGIGQLYSRIVNDGYDTDTILYFKTGPASGSGDKLQLTSNFEPLAADNGYTFLPGGIVFQWGSESTIFNSQTINVVFPKAFAHNIYSIQVSLSGGNSSSDRRTLTITTTSLTGFTAFLVGGVNGGYDGFYWFAVGN